MSMSGESGRTALLVIDLQQGTMANARAFSSADWLERAASVIDAFHERALPVVMASAIGTPRGRTQYAPGGRDFPAEAAVLLPEITTADDDIFTSRHGLSVFSDVGLTSRLSGEGVTNLVIIGIATSFGVESTARAAYDLGFSVVVVSDAIADVQQSSHEHALTTVFPAIGIVRTAGEVIADLDEVA
jgi:nicotinamidase-related amidase